ncbi:hypothetical protein [Lichenibacterium ramalinae]|nr:hypothetical protein [Lichenibacterium ramalinae]
MRYAKPDAILARARPPRAETRTIAGEACATGIETRNHIRQMYDLIDDTRRMVEASWEAVKRCPTL